MTWLAVALALVSAVVVMLAVGWYLRRHSGRHPAPPSDLSCEICHAPDVVRHGKWDHCPRGHIYVNRREGAS